MFKTRKEFQKAAERLQHLASLNEREELSDEELLREWKSFMRDGKAFLKELEKEIKIN